MFDLRRLRGMTADDFEYFEADAHYDGIGRAHNIAANPETETLYVVGCTDAVGSRKNYTVCNGNAIKFIFSTHIIQGMSVTHGTSTVCGTNCPETVG